jgi:hypothetical protein
MMRYNFSNVIEEHIKSLSVDLFNSMAGRLLTKLNPEANLSTERFPLLITKGIILDSILYLTIGFNDKKEPLRKDPIPPTKDKYTILTIITNFKEKFDNSAIKLISKAHPKIVINFWGIDEIVQIINQMDIHDITYILGDSIFSSYMNISCDESKNRKIIQKIFEFIFSTPIPDNLKGTNGNGSDLVFINKKIEINFSQFHHSRIRDMYKLL